jgi:hypothetical protein
MDLLLKYSRIKECRIRGKAELLERVNLLSEKEPKLNSEKNRKYQFWPSCDNYHRKPT